MQLLRGAFHSSVPWCTLYGDQILIYVLRTYNTSLSPVLKIWAIIFQHEGRFLNLFLMTELSDHVTLLPWKQESYGAQVCRIVYMLLLDNKRFRNHISRIMCW
jgi:hypothetical protein